MLIKVSESTIVLTGGRITLNLVTEYSGLETGGWEVFFVFASVFVFCQCQLTQFHLKVSSRQLASLGTGRRQHACGSYPGPDGQVPPSSFVSSSFLLVAPILGQMEMAFRDYAFWVSGVKPHFVYVCDDIKQP